MRIRILSILLLIGVTSIFALPIVRIGNLATGLKCVDTNNCVTADVKLSPSINFNITENSNLITQDIRDLTNTIRLSLGTTNIITGNLDLGTGTLKGSDLSIGWSNLTNYPSACGTGQAITQIGDSLTCSSFLTSYTETDPQVGTVNNGGWCVGGASSVLSCTNANPDTDTNANTICTGTTTYLDGEGNCDEISNTYVDVAGDTLIGQLNADGGLRIGSSTTGRAIGKLYYATLDSTLGCAINGVNGLRYIDVPTNDWDFVLETLSPEAQGSSATDSGPRAEPLDAWYSTGTASSGGTSCDGSCVVARYRCSGYDGNIIMRFSVLLIDIS